MAIEEERWQPARLFPITGIGGADEQERRGCSALLAVIQGVKEFGRALTARCGAPAGTIETFIEVPFVKDGAQFRPDGLIRVVRGQRSWVALVELKAGKTDLSPEQVTNYLDIAREQNFDAVITISHEVMTTPGVHPVEVDKRKLKKVGLFHLSWSRIHTRRTSSKPLTLYPIRIKPGCYPRSFVTSRTRNRVRSTSTTWDRHG
jgi:hypothetical protein